MRSDDGPAVGNRPRRRPGPPVSASRPAVEKVKGLVLGDPEIKAVAAAVETSFTAVEADHREVWREHDVNLEGFLHEAAAELGSLLVGRTPDGLRLAGAVVDGLRPDLEMDERWARMETLRASLDAFTTHLRDELARVPALRDRLPVAPPDEDAVRLQYLRWVTKQFRYVDTTGIGTTGHLSLPLSDVFVSLDANRLDINVGSRVVVEEVARFAQLGSPVPMTPEEIEAAVDRSSGLGTGPDRATRPIDLLGLVGETSRLVIVGDPGSGKTTVLRFLALQHARALLGDRRAVEVVGRPVLPMYVAIADFMQSGESSLRGYLASAPGRMGFGGTSLQRLFDQVLDSEDAVVLIDGLDEVGSADRRAQSVRAIRTLADSLDATRIKVLVTTRPAGYRAAPLPDRFQHVEVQDMDDDAVDAFLGAYLPEAIRAGAPHMDPQLVAEQARQAQDQISAAIAASPGIRRLAANPLLLAAIVLVHRTSGGLPGSRIELYEQVDAALVETWRRHGAGAGSERPDPQDVRHWLRTLAWWMHEHRPQRAVTARDLVEVLGPLWCERQGVDWDASVLERGDLDSTAVGRGVGRFVGSIAEHTGLLVERAPGRWGFPHLTFQEYYAALSLMQDGRRVDRPRRVRAVLHRPTYEEVVLLALAMMARQSESDEDRWEAFAAAALGVPPPGTRWDLPVSPHEALFGRDGLMALRALGDDLNLPRSEVRALIRAHVLEVATGSARIRYWPYRQRVLDHLARLERTRFGSVLVEEVEAHWRCRADRTRPGPTSCGSHLVLPRPPR